VLPEEQPPAPPGRPPSRRPPRRPRPRLRPWRLALLAVLGALLVLLLWIGYGYWQFRGSLSDANKRVDARTQAALTPGGSLLSDASTTLVLGSDRRPNGGAGRSDSILLVRVDPGANRIAELSIPRDLRVTIPGHGDDRINVAYTLGGPALAIQTVRALTGIPINHVVLVDFSGFRELVDALGGVTIDNPTKIISNSFDGHPWRFGRGRLHLDGRHALAYARVRENTANASDNDLTRGLRQQRVLQAIGSSLASPGTLLHLPRVGDAIGKPLTTDLSANDLLELGWRQLRASSTLHCHLGGTITSVGGASELIGGDENRRVILAVLGKSAPLAPAPGDTFAAGCT
jgi:LCP family protein required for cell wall assembly